MRELDLAYQECQRVARREAKNFYYAFITLPKSKRQAIYAAYALCRLCDDATDEPISLDEKLARLRDTEEKLSLGLAGQPVGPVFTAVADAARNFNIPHHYFEAVIRGVEVDLTQKRFQDFEALRQYCYGVASVVGLICLEVFRYNDPKAREYAVELGLAMQLTNIIRDIKEDMERDRIYIPLEEMARFGYSETDIENCVTNQAFYNLMQFQVQRARHYFKSGLRLLPLLSLRSRACPAILGALYTRILDRIESNNFNVFEGRISLSRREKLLLAVKTWLKSMLPYALSSPA